MSVSKKTSQKPMSMTAFSIEAGPCPRCSREGFVLGIFVRILLTVIHLFLESLCLLLVAERKTCQTFFKLKGVEEDTVLIVRKMLVELLVPYDTAVGRLDCISSHCR